MKAPIINFGNFLVLLFFAITSAKGQSYYFRHYQVENGLSNNTVFCSGQDSNGFLWFGTKDGLNRFDGYNFRVFHPGNKNANDDLNANFILSLLPVDSGNLWVGAFTGLYKYESARERILPVIDTLKTVHSIQVDEHGNVWFIANETTCRFEPRKNILTKFPAQSFFRASALCLTNDGTVWVGTDNGFLEKFDSATGKFTAYNVFHHSTEPPSRRIEKLKPGPGSSLFVGTWSQGIKQFFPAQNEYTDLLALSSPKSSIYVRDILQTSPTEYWFATELGIFILNTTSNSFINLKKEFSDPYSLTDNAVYTLCKDSEGNIWAGTYFGGVNYYSRQNSIFKKYLPDNSDTSISGNAVREICADDFGNIWMSTEDNGITKLNTTTGRLTQFLPTGDPGSIDYNNIHGLLANGNDLWIGTFNYGINILDIPTGKVKKRFLAGAGPNDIKSNFSYCFLKTRNGNIYTGTNAGIFRYRPGTDGFERIPVVDSHVYVQCLIEDQNHLIWVGTGGNGLHWFDPATNEYGRISKEFEQGITLQNKTINDIYEDDHYNLWIATDGAGLCSINRQSGKVNWYTSRNGLPGNFVFKVLQDNNKLFWITTSNGLVSLDPASGKMEVYTQANGLLNNQFNYHSGYKDDQGRLYFGSVRGLISFDPAKLSHSTFNPPIYITGLQIYDKEISVASDSNILRQSLIYTDQISLSHRQSTISIEFAALSFLSPEMTAYSYRMLGLNKEWTNIKTNRKAYFTNLNPGKYIFEVKSRNANGKDGTPAKITIIIRPPFWLTKGAIIFYGVLFVLAIFLILRNYHKRQQNKKEKEIYRSKIDFFTNVAHEIRTPLTLIKGPVENILEKENELPEIQEDIACLDRNTNRLMALTSQILDFRQTELKAFSLDFESVNVVEILNETYMSFQVLLKKRNLQFELITFHQQITLPADPEALRKIFSNLIGNAVKYAESYVKIRVYYPENGSGGLKIEFENDGNIISPEFRHKIFEPFFRLKEKKHQKGTGIGLALAKSLTELHNGQLYLDISKKDSNVFTLILPLQRSLLNDQSHTNKIKV